MKTLFFLACLGDCNQVLYFKTFSVSDLFIKIKLTGFSQFLIHQWSLLHSQRKSAIDQSTFSFFLLMLSDTCIIMLCLIRRLLLLPVFNASIPVCTSYPIVYKYNTNNIETIHSGETGGCLSILVRFGR